MTKKQISDSGTKSLYKTVMSTNTVETRPQPAPLSDGEVWIRPGWGRLLRRLGLLIAVTLAVGLLYFLVIEPWHMNWGPPPLR